MVVVILSNLVVGVLTVLRFDGLWKSIDKVVAFHTFSEVTGECFFFWGGEMEFELVCFRFELGS